MTATAERHEFQAEVKQILDLLIHSLYSNKEIFLRELISNASDALDKLKFESLTRSELLSDEPLQIRITRDAGERTLAVSDNGIGMSRDELVQDLGTIAHSGTVEFIKAVSEAKDQSVALELIGQFGVGFYSAFMVADRVTVVTRRAGESQAWKWESAGEGEFTLEPTERVTSGTTVMLHLRPTEDEDGLQDFTAEWVVRDVVKRHSDFVSYPIVMEVEETAGDPPTTTTVDKTLNSMKAIWTRPPTEVSDDEYREFYKHITHDWADPLTHLSVHMEGTVEARALLFIPSRAPFDLYHREMSFRGLQLYIRRVFIMDECQDLMPLHLRFIKGVVDSDDLSLNVSREILQKDRKITAIRRFLVRKVLETLGRLMREQREQYREFWTQFGPVLKEGLIAADDAREKLLDLVLVRSTRDPDGWTTLGDYVSRMQPGQKEILFLTAPTLDAARQAPHLEIYRDKGFEVLLFTDHVDEVWLQNPPEFQGHRWGSVGRGSVELGDEAERAEAKKTLEEQTASLKDLLALFQELLDDDVKEVRATNRLTSSPACLVAERHDLSPHLIEVLRQAGQDVPKPKRILEINPDHEIIQKLKARFDADRRDAVVRDHASLLYGLAVLAEGGQLPDPAAMSRQLSVVLEKGLS